MKLGISLIAIVVAGGVAAFAVIVSIASSDSCGGCDTTPAWAEVLAVVVYVAFALWVVVAVVTAFRALRRRRSTTAA